jgi:hypothetical protein
MEQLGISKLNYSMFQSSTTSCFNNLRIRIIYNDSITEEDECTSRLGH